MSLKRLKLSKALSISNKKIVLFRIVSFGYNALMKHIHRRSFRQEFVWPAPPLNVVLVEPEIPPNTGNIARLCAATGAHLHLAGQLGFRLNDAKLKRAGLDYWPAVNLHRHADLTEILGNGANRFFLFSTAGKKSYLSVSYRPGDYLIFGSESKGLPDYLLEKYPDQTLGIPMQTDLVRSLNLATAVGIALYEALRQIQQ